MRAQFANNWVQATPGYAWLFVLAQVPGAPDPEPASESMRKKALILGMLAAALLLAGVFLATPRQPSYQGIKLRDWLEVLYPPSGCSKAERQRAEEAVRTIGPDGLPWLVGWLKAEDRPIGKAFAQRYWASLLPFGISRLWTPAADHNAKAVGAFKVLGKVADPAIPELVGIVTNAPDPGRVFQGLRALCGIGSERAFDAVMSLKSSRPQFTEEFLKSAFLASNPGMGEYVERRLERNRSQR